MKRIITIIAIAAVSTALLMNCRKDKYMAQPTDNYALKQSATDVANSTIAKVSYTMKVTQPATIELMEWTSGRMMVGELVFVAGIVVGNAEKKAQFTASANRNVALLPASVADHTTLLPELKMPFNKYFGARFGVVLQGVSAPGSLLQGQMLELNGQYMNKGNNIAVRVIMDQPVELMANLQTPVLYLYNEPENIHYTAALTFNLKQLLGTINSSMLDHAVVADNTILISENSNQNLYQLIRNNLAGTLSVELTADFPMPGPKTTAPPIATQ